MSDVDIDTLISTLSSSADSFSLKPKESKIPGGMTQWKLHLRYGRIGKPDLVDVIIMTNLPPREKDGVVIVRYVPSCRIITVGGKPLHDLYVGHNLYEVRFDKKKPELALGLAEALNPFSNPVASALSVTGF